MTNLAKTIGLLEKRLDHSNNDLFKHMAGDLLKLFDQEINQSSMKSNNYEIWVEALRTEYKNDLHIAREKLKQQSKQIDIEDEIKNIRQ